MRPRGRHPGQPGQYGAEQVGERTLVDVGLQLAGRSAASARPVKISGGARFGRQQRQQIWMPLRLLGDGHDGTVIDGRPLQLAGMT